MITGFTGVFPTASETINAFVARLAVEVNSNSPTTLIGAVAIENTLYLSRTVTTSFDAPLTITSTLAVSDNGAIVSGVVSGGLSVITDSAAVNATSSASFRTSYPVTAVVNSGIGPFQYVWKEASSGSANGIEINSPNSQTTTFSKGGLLSTVPSTFNYPFNQPKTVSTTVRGTFACVVTTPAGLSGISNIVRVTL